MGDGIIAIFEFKEGNSYDHITSALDAVNSAIELNNSSEKIRSEWIKI
jgi:hypothetical protein